MPRFKLVLEYDGSPFVGWQAQALGRSVQETIEAAVLRMTGEAVRLQAAGRTDAGVHATAQVAHVDLARDWPPRVLQNGLNAHLRPDPIAVLAAAAVPDSFHARFSAVGRLYRYRILDRRAPPAIERQRVWHVPQRLDAEAMAEAAAILVGRHDFTTFRAAGCQAKSPIKTLDRLDVTRDGDLVRIAAAARSFLHAQVRSMVGSLVQVGLGRWTSADMATALAAADRRACGPVAPACGLFLTGVVYPGDSEEKAVQPEPDHQAEQ